MCKFKGKVQYRHGNIPYLRWLAPNELKLRLAEASAWKWELLCWLPLSLTAASINVAQLLLANPTYARYSSASSGYISLITRIKSNMEKGGDASLGYAGSTMAGAVNYDVRAVYCTHLLVPQYVQIYVLQHSPAQQEALLGAK